MSEPAFCTAACPFNFDVRAFTEKIKQHRLTAAYKQYRDAVVFPGIVSRICGRPCEKACPLGPVDKPIDIQGLEYHVTENAKAHAPDSYNLPPRGKSVAVIGAGLSGLACALKLTQKKYSVTVFGPAQSLPESFLKEIDYQFESESCERKTDKINSRDDIMAMGFDAVYVATGEGGETFGLPVSDIDTSAGGNAGSLPSMLIPGHNEEGTGNPAHHKTRGGLHDLAAEAGVCWIAGGALAGRKDACAIADGAIAAAAIDAFFRAGVVKTDRPPRTTKMVLAPLHLERYKSALLSSLPDSLRDLQREAERCLGCRCDACKIYCDLPAYADKWPPRISDEVFVTTLPGKAEVKATPAKRLINTDNLSGVLVNVCPAGIDMDALLLAGRQSMHRQDKMPWAFHEFWLRDMEHAGGEDARILLDTRNGKTGFDKAIAFFPGCQLGAAAPALVQAAFEELKTLNGERKISLSGMMARCCGAPAEWAGDEELFADELTALRADWNALGSPILACACPTCMRMLARHAPEIETISLYEVLPPAPGSGNSLRDWAVFDPCSAAHINSIDSTGDSKDGEDKTAAIKKSVREHAAAMGLSIEPLPIQENVQRCCGYGGQPECADPAFVNTVRENRAAESGLPYLCYCMNCREAFLKTGKPSAHILELRYPDIEGAPELSPSLRRYNRERLKASLLDSQGISRWDPGCEPSIVIPVDVLARMDADKIISDDVRDVIYHMLRTKESVFHPATGVHSGSLIIGRTTYWADYTEEDGTMTVTNVYAHRLAVEHEEVWAGTTKEQRLKAAQDKQPEESSKPVHGETGLTCELCNVEMKEMNADFSYLGRSFRHKVMRCPVCGLAYIPEALARGRIRDVEMSLEDK